MISFDIPLILPVDPGSLHQAGAEICPSPLQSSLDPRVREIWGPRRADPGECLECNMGIDIGIYQEEWR